MLGYLSHTRVLRFAGLFTWAIVCVPLIYTQVVPVEGEATPALSEALWLFASYLGFGGCYFWLTRGLGGGHARWYDRAMLMMLTVCGLAVSYFNGSGLGSILLMVAAGVIPWLLPVRTGVLWLLLSQLAVLPVYYGIMGMPLFEAIMQSLLYGGFSMFIFVTSLVARQQAQARDEQRRLNAELRATRVLLAESARVNERTRISRELHDLLGHHLTALSLNLEVAGHMTQGRAQEHVKQAHTLARLLLTDVREVVSQLREGDTIDLGAALLLLAERVPGLQVHMDIQEPLTLDDAERAHVLLRCTQEIITNTVRHADARNLWIHCHRKDDQIVIDARDDGNGAEKVTAGNGLRGMHERLRQQGGNMTIESRAGGGFRLCLQLPVGTNEPLVLGTSSRTYHRRYRMIRVCLVDDQTLVRQGIRSLLALDGGIEVVAEASDGKQAVELIPQVKPDVVLMDMRMPVMSGLEALQALAALGQLPPAIILTTFDDDQLVLAGLKAGAKGYLLKDVSLEQLVGAIRTVSTGGSLVQPAVTQRLLSGLEHMRNDFVSLDRPDPLTDRETEILRLMASGFSNKEIANSLGVAEGTIKNHVSNILSKLGVRDRTRAVLKAFELQLV